MRRAQAEQMRAAIGLIEPMGLMVEKIQEVLEAHHPAGFDADDCPVCLSYQHEMQEILDHWADARSRVQEHWDL